jgi:hypothetical protein
VLTQFRGAVYLIVLLHGVTSVKKISFITTAVRASNPIHLANCLVTFSPESADIEPVCTRALLES